MFRLLGRIPESCYLACSGGSDSMVFADFMLRFPRRKFEIIHFNHGTEYCDEAEAFVRAFAERNRIPFHSDRIADPEVPDGESRENYWRDARYSFFSKFSDRPIVTCHHLNDCVETWIMTSLTGNPRLIPYRNARYNVIRPFLAVPKSEIESWAARHHVKYVTDGSNFDTSIRRNYVRHVMMEHVRKVNPGIETTVRNLVLKAFSESAV